MTRRPRARALEAMTFVLLFCAAFTVALVARQTETRELHRAPPARLSLRAIPSPAAGAAAPAPVSALPSFLDLPAAAPEDALPEDPPADEPAPDPRLLLAQFATDPLEEVRSEAWALDAAFQLEEPPLF